MILTPNQQIIQSMRQMTIHTMDHFLLPSGDPAHDDVPIRVIRVPGGWFYSFEEDGQWSQQIFVRDPNKTIVRLNSIDPADWGELEA